MKMIKIATEGTPHDYKSSLMPIVIESMGYKISWVEPAQADLLILGPFLKKDKKQFGWCPKPLRPLMTSINQSIGASKNTRVHQPIKIFHTQENERHDFVDADYSISFDLGVQSNKHFRFPYWMEMIDWSHEGVMGNSNPRYGELLKLSTLMSPLGEGYLKRGGKCALFSSHLREPRDSLYKALGKIIPTQGFGAFFDKKIKDHHSSGFLKKDTLKNFSFNLCPENGLYPGYYTEKIPEAFNSGCLPITWADENISVDFNPNAFINMHTYAGRGYGEVNEIFSNKNLIEQYQNQALINEKPTLEPVKQFLIDRIQEATS